MSFSKMNSSLYQTGKIQDFKKTKLQIKIRSPVKNSAAFSL